MPYIEKKDRPNYDELTTQLVDLLEDVDFNVGHVNYVVYSIMQEWFYRRMKYSSLNDIRGVLGNVASEVYRKLAVPYEDKKCQQNGDIDRLSRRCWQGKWKGGPEESPLSGTWTGGFYAEDEHVEARMVAEENYTLALAEIKELKCELRELRVMTARGWRA